MFLDKAKDTSTSLMDDATQTAHQAIQTTQQAASEALVTLSGALQDLRHKAEHASDHTVAYIKHDPVKSVLIAAATGAALMALISLISHNRSHQ